MCANCVSRADVVVTTIGLASYVLRDPVKAGLVELGVLPEPHPLAVEMRTVTFLRDLDLDPVAVLGDELVVAVDAALAFPRPLVYRRTLRDALALLFGGSMRSQRKLAAQ